MEEKKKREGSGCVNSQCTSGPYINIGSSVANYCTLKHYHKQQLQESKAEGSGFGSSSVGVRIQFHCTRNAHIRER